MARVLIVLIVIVVFVSLAAGVISTFVLREVKGSGNITTEAREVRDFDQVSICCGMHLQITQSSPASLQLEGDDNIITDIVTSVKGDRLTIDYGRLRLRHWPSQPVVVRVTMPEVSGLDVSGGGRVDATRIETPHLEIDLSGGSAGNLGSLTTTDLQVNVSGGGGLELAGNATHQSLRSSGGGHYNSTLLQSQSADLNLSGGGSAVVWVEETLTIKASGGSHVDYYGSANVSQSTSGGSRVTHLGEQP